MRKLFLAVFVLMLGSMFGSTVFAQEATPEATPEMACYSIDEEAENVAYDLKDCSEEGFREFYERIISLLELSGNLRLSTEQEDSLISVLTNASLCSGEWEVFPCVQRVKLQKLQSSTMEVLLYAIDWDNQNPHSVGKNDWIFGQEFNHLGAASAGVYYREAVGFQLDFIRYEADTEITTFSMVPNSPDPEATPEAEAAK